MKSKDKASFSTISRNRNAYREYFVLESHEAGIELLGTEVKSLRNASVNLKESWAGFVNGELFVHQMHISPYEHGNIFNVDPVRARKLLMHKFQLRKLFDQIKQGGLTLIPLSIYFKNSLVKIEIGVCKGKKLYDKRNTIKDREDKRKIQRALKDYN